MVLYNYGKAWAVPDIDRTGRNSESVTVRFLIGSLARSKIVSHALPMGQVRGRWRPSYWAHEKVSGQRLRAGRYSPAGPVFTVA
jgi:hypothetical protein